jgi:glycosyltransferase involved in cell wall biosynthesis
MRIAILTTDLRETFRDYVNPEPRFGVAPGALLEGFMKLREAEVHVVSCLQNPVQAPEKVADNIWYHALHVPKIGWMRTGYQGCIRAVRKKLREIQPDIVHGQGTERDCAISAVFSGFPNVITVHGNMRAIAKFYRAQPGSFHWLAAKLETLALRKTGGVLCNSAYTEKLIASCARRVWRVPNCLRAAFFETPFTEKRGAKPILLNVGLISPHKRQVEILAVACKLWQRGLHFELQFIGTTGNRTEYAANFMRQIAEAQIAGYARHIGTLEIKELIAAFDCASASIHFPFEESFGLVAAEALARNLKLFGASVGGLIDIAANVEGAELLPMNDWTALENSIACWLEAGCPRPQTAGETMHARYAPKIVARRHLEIYREFFRA